MYKYKKHIKWSLTISILLLLLQILEYDFFTLPLHILWIGAILFWILKLLLSLSFIVFLLCNLFYLFIKRHIALAKPTLLQLLVLAAVLFIPFGEMRFEMDFALKLKERERILNNIKTGVLKPGERNIINLPKEYKMVSHDSNRVFVLSKEPELQVLFFTFEGLTDNFQAIVYIESDKEPADDILGSEVIYKEKLRERWWYVSAT